MVHLSHLSSRTEASPQLPEGWPLRAPSWDPLQALPSSNGSHFSQSYATSWGQPHPIIGHVRLNSPTFYPQLGTTLKRHPSSRAPHKAGCSLCCNCLTIQLLPLSHSAFFTPRQVLIPRKLPNKCPACRFQRQNLIPKGIQAKSEISQISSEINPSSWLCRVRPHASCGLKLVPFLLLFVCLPTYSLVWPCA